MSDLSLPGEERRLPVVACAKSRDRPVWGLADICRVARDLQNRAAQADVIADFRLLRATPYPEGRLGGTNRLRLDLARNIAAYPAFLPILLSLQEGLFFSLYLARFSRNQR